MSKNEMESIDGVGDLRNLTGEYKFYIHDYSFLYLNTIGTATEKILNLSNNQITRVPQGIVNCEKLKALILNNNQLKTVDNILGLSELGTLVISHNQIEALSGLVGMSGLTKLSAAHNKLRVFPNFGDNEKMKEMRLNNNKIQKVPEYIGKCINLSVLDLGNNLIAEFSSIESLRLLRHLDNLNLKGNAITEVEGYREKVLEMIPSLRILDGQRFDPKFLARKEKRAIIDEIKVREKRERDLGLKPGALKKEYMNKSQKKAKIQK
ncbi:Leucine-rich repeat-containing protein 48 [Zancudomyces culisetae]|nr:Leucine-rich repeat-containing protein 48 [Zancudomyces culisetae]|eukprot:OMH85586.1 Leucine-rich repeat-containing protein 48 [Zancudomyces culisetae]